ncbi:MAG: translocation/assembly module TamB domain-containing protein [Longimicrobiales bacterium]
MPVKRFRRWVTASQGRAIAAGIAAIVVAVVLIIAVAVTRDDADPAIPEDALEADSLLMDQPALELEATRDEVGGFEQRIAERLAARPAPTGELGPVLRVRLADVDWRDRAGRPFLLADVAVARMDHDAFKAGRVVLSDVTLEAPRVLLVRETPNAQWNYIPVLGFDRPPRAPRAADELRGSAETGVFVRALTMRNGRVEIRLPTERYVFTDLAGRVPAIDLPSGNRAAEIRIAALESTLEVPAEDRVLPFAIADARLLLPGGRVDFTIGDARLADTRLAALEGTWDPDLPGLGLRASGFVERVELADIRFLYADLPEEGTASFAWRIEPTAAGNEVTVRDLALSSGPNSVAGTLAFRFGDAGFALGSLDLQLEPLSLELVERFLDEPLPYTGTLRGRVYGDAAALRFDLAAAVRARGTDQDLRTDVTGLAALDNGGFQLRRLEADLRDAPLVALRGFLPGLPVAGTITGRVTLLGPPGETPLDVDVSLELAGGTAAVRGTLDLTGAVIVYDLTGSLLAVDLQQLVEPSVPPILLTAEFALAGSGTDPETADASLSLRGDFAGWQTAPADHVDLRVRLAGGMLNVDTLDAVVGPLAAEVNGVWATRADRDAPGLSYRVAVTTLAPLAPYLPFIPEDATAGGAVDLAGQLRGSLQRPQFVGDMQLREVRYGDWAVGAAEGSYDVALGDSIPVIHVALGARGIETPTAGAFEAASLDVAVSRPTFSLVGRFDRVIGGVGEIELEGRFLDAGANEAVVRHLLVDLGEDRWSLAEPALVTWGGVPGVVVEDLLVESTTGDGELALGGTVWPLADADVRFRLRDLPAGELQQMLGQEPVLSGRIWAEGSIVGGEAPVVLADFRVANGSLQTVAFELLEGAVEYRDTRADLTLDAVLAPGGRLVADLQLPVLFRLTDDPSFGWAEAGALAGTIEADSLPLQLLSNLLPQVRDPEGSAAGRVVLAGSAAAPEFQGALQLTGGAFTLPALRQRYTGIEGTLSLADERVSVDDIVIRSDGTARLSGSIVFEQLDRPIADLEVVLEGFRPLGVGDVDPAAVWGTLSVDGPFSALVLGGDLRVDDGTIEVPDFGSDPFSQEMRDFVEAGGDATAGLDEPEGGLDYDIRGMTVRFGSATWFVVNTPETSDARVQLGGELTLFGSGDDLRIFGTLSGERGTFTLTAGLLVRRFEVREAQIRFFGEADPNPQIDIIASRTIYTAAGEEIEVLANVTGTASRPRLSLATAQGTQIPESELLSFLLFGQPSGALGGGLTGTEQLLESTLLGGLADWFTLGLEEAFIEELGLDYFQLRFAQPTLGGIGGIFEQPMLVFGKEVSSDVFLRVTTGLGGLLGASASFEDAFGIAIEWRIDREWRLEGGIEPTVRRRLSPFGIRLNTPLSNPDIQWFVDLRRRWTY